MSDITAENKSEITIAIIGERVLQIADDIQWIKQTMNDQSKTISEIPVIRRDIKQHDEQLERAFRAIKANSEATISNTQAIVAAKTIWRIVGAISVFGAASAVSLAGWSYNQLDQLHRIESEMSLRLNTLEVKSAEADKFQQQGFVRK